jgi:hypothetical protein
MGMKRIGFLMVMICVSVFTAFGMTFYETP